MELNAIPRKIWWTASILLLAVAFLLSSIGWKVLNSQDLQVKIDRLEISTTAKEQLGINENLQNSLKQIEQLTSLATKHCKKTDQGALKSKPDYLLLQSGKLESSLKAEKQELDQLSTKIIKIQKKYQAKD